MIGDAKRPHGLTLLVCLFVWGLGLAACGGDAGYQAPQPRVFTQEELDELVADGLAVETPQISAEELELMQLKQYRIDVAETMRAEVASAMVPLSLAAGLFAIEGAGDVVLSLVPFHQLRGMQDADREQMAFANPCQRQAGHYDPLASLAHWATGLSLLASSSDSPARWPVLAHEVMPVRLDTGT